MTTNATILNNMNTAARLATFHAANAAVAAKTKYADYRVCRIDANGDAVGISEVSFPNDVRNANFGGVCFYDAAMDTFRGTTEVNGFLLERVV